MPSWFIIAAMVLVAFLATWFVGEWLCRRIEDNGN